MKIILLESVDKLGKSGEVVRVKDGYASNYLIPRGIALKAIKENFKKLEIIQQKKDKLSKKEKRSLLTLKEKIEQVSLTIPVEVKEENEIYGSISETQILKILKEEGIYLDKGKLVLQEPLRKLGVYNLKINLYPEVEANLRVWIVKK